MIYNCKNKVGSYHARLSTDYDITYWWLGIHIRGVNSSFLGVYYDRPSCTTVLASSLHP